MNDNVTVLEHERAKRIDDPQWEALAYLTNHGPITIGPYDDHPPQILRTLLGPCSAMRLCRCEPSTRTLTLSTTGRSALAYRLRLVEPEAPWWRRLAKFADCLAARHDADDEALAELRFVDLRGDWTWRTELGHLVIKLERIGLNP